ncbi:heavy metal translocating P-type ATPase [Limibaculum sp. FT325]|uniref:heavy metal translocating P-type ATPase n=1 Tax=Thermohalobaculum sediminis TaxID=2939436 RepID=UPI0020C08BDD|nr:heavy metal translocating P-type ATPase [Limibaculum sediminis]MCL5778363.1 heavy metal translocating P-type ATPase [Limibaculum sediminis]
MTLPDLDALRRAAKPGLVALPALGLAAGLGLWWGGQAGAASAVWMLATLPVLGALVVEIVTTLRRGETGLDIVAAVSMTAALVFGETLAAAVVALMYAGGQHLEDFASHRARREMTDLLSRVPRTALRHRDGGLEEVPLDAIAPGDRLMIRQGDIAPVDGSVAGGLALLDESALTGESLPVRRGSGEAVMSGSTNAGGAFDLMATRRAAESTYAGIVRLVEQAQASRAPMARMADRYAMGFLALTLTIAGVAWSVTGDPIRAVAVLVVATPCPLILAVPVALVAGLSRAAHQGVLIKGAKVLEVLGQVRGIVIDKTGTLTDGRPGLVAIERHDTLAEDEILRLAASLEQASKHPVAQAIVAEARGRGLGLGIPEGAVETPGEGVDGRVEGRAVVVGGPGFVARRLGLDAPEGGGSEPGSVTVSVAVDGQLAATLTLADALRAGTGDFLAALRRLGVERIVLATGDRRVVAEAVTEGLGFDAVRAELSPDQKVLVVVTERKVGPVMMIGDGVNDAPALAAADVGVAMGARGTAASAEAADVVLLVDRLDRILPGIEIARGARAIAMQSVMAGIGLSLAGMIAAALGHITPVQGALLQEAIDVAVILNALRALRIGPGRPEAGEAVARATDLRETGGGRMRR